MFQACACCNSPTNISFVKHTPHSEHKTHTVNRKTCLIRLWKPQSTQALYSQALRAQTRPALSPRPSPWPVPSALKQTHPAPFNGEHLRYAWLFLTHMYWRCPRSHLNTLYIKSQTRDPYHRSVVCTGRWSHRRKHFWKTDKNDILTCAGQPISDTVQLY